RARFEHRLERRPLDVLERDREQAVLLDELEQPDDVLALELAEDRGLAVEALRDLRIAREVAVDDLERDARVAFAREAHDAVRAFSDDAIDAIAAADRRPDRERRVPRGVRRLRRRAASAHRPAPSDLRRRSLSGEGSGGAALRAGARTSGGAGGATRTVAA